MSRSCLVGLKVKNSKNVVVVPEKTISFAIDVHWDRKEAEECGNAGQHAGDLNRTS